MDHDLYKELSLIVIRLHYLASKVSLPTLIAGLRKIADELSDLIEEKVTPDARFK